MPVIASETLKPGTHVGWASEQNEVKAHSAPFGIVDPFLTKPVKKGESFWLFLYENTVTGMRHHWEHPAFPLMASTDSKGIGARDPECASKRWIEDFAARIDQTYNSVMDAADLYLDSGEHTYDNTEAYKDHWDEFADFWKHYEVVTGKTVKDKDSFFTCSC